MNILLSIIFISILLTTNAQWYVKKTYHTKSNYPNPGKRSLPEQESTSIKIDCSIPYSQLHSYQQKTLWLFTCGYIKSPLKTDNNLLSSDSDNLETELPTTSNLILHERRSSHVVPPYFPEDDNSFNKFLTKLLRRVIKNK